MAEFSIPFDGGPNREVRENEWSKMARNWRGDGVLPDADNVLGLELLATWLEGMTIAVYPGRAWIQGHYYENDSILEKVLAPADPSFPRIDRVVLRNDWLQDQITVEVLTGTPSATPTPPPLTQTFGSRWEIPLAQIMVDAGATEPSGFLDERPLSHQAGVVPACILTCFTSLAIPEGSQVKLVWDVGVVNTIENMWDWENDEIEIPEDGLYLCFFNVGFDANEASSIEGILRIREVDTGAEHDLGRSNEQGIQDGHEYSNVTVVRYLPKGTRVFVLGEQSNDGDGTAEPASVIVGNYQPTFGVIKIGEGGL